MIKKDYTVLGMNCASCANNIENAVKKIKGVNSVTVSLLTNSMTVIYNDSINEKDIIKTVSNMGYQIKYSNIISDNDTKNININEIKKLSSILSFSLIALIPLFYISMGYMLNWNIGIFTNRPFFIGIAEMALSLIILILNKMFFVSGIKKAIHKSANMDTLISLGCLTAFLYSFVILMIMAFHFENSNINSELIMTYSMYLNFETAGMVPTLITIGKLLEAISKGKTTSAIDALAKLTIKNAVVIKDNKESIIPIEDVKKNDILIVKPGESFPVDGIIINGSCSVDASSLTGESIPVFKNINDEVNSSTINLNGVVYIKATKVGDETTLNKIIDMVKTASTSKAPINKIADKVSGIFVPVILLISFVTLISWLIIGLSRNNTNHINEISYAINKAISVLVIACPCALGLATPVAIMVANGKAAKNGIFFKDAESLENISYTDFVVFDKTGTLTFGKPVVTDILSYDTEYNEDEILKLAYSLEKNSKHPLAIAIIKKAENLNISNYLITDFKEIAGVGITGKINDDMISIYNFNEIKRQNIFLNPSIQNKYIELSSAAKTTFFIILNNKIIGAIALKDMTKPDAKNTIAELKKMNIIPIMLTGDNRITSKKIADELNIDYFISEILPADKLKYVSFFQKYGKVVMVGDGINDAPALTKADVSIAISQGSEIAVDCGNVILMKNSLIDVPACIKLSKHTLFNIKENLFFAFLYNIIMIPIAAGLFKSTNIDFLANMQPYYGAIAMSLSSLCVILNALRLNHYNMYKSNDLKHKKVKIDDEFNKIFIDNSSILNNVIYVKKKLIINNMMCENCVKHINETLNQLDYIKSCSIDLATHEVLIEINANIDNKTLDAVLNKIDYKIDKIIEIN